MLDTLWGTLARLPGWMLTAVLPLTFITLVLVAVLPLVYRRCSARSVHWALFILLAAFLIPVRPALIRVPLPQPVQMPVQIVQPVTLPAAQPVSTGTQSVQDVMPVTTPVTVPTPAAPALTLTQALLFSWAAGTLIMLLWHTVHHIRFARLVRRWAMPVRNPMVRELYEQTAREEHAPNVPLYLCQAVRTPMLVGLIKPRVLLPDEKLSLSELHFVFRHEFMHLKRRDLWMKALQGLAVCAYWWNPAVHLLSRAMQSACESACDEALLRGAELPQRQFYSETILSVIRRQPHTAPMLTTGFYGGKKGMKKRITNILDMGTKRFGAVLTAFVLLCATFAGLAAPEGQDDFHPTERVTEAGFLANETGVIHLNSVPTDYEYAQVVYFTGVPVIMDEIIHKQTQYGVEDWIHFTVPAGSGETVMSGYTPFENFVKQDKAALLTPFPRGELRGDTLTGTVPLYRDNGITKDVLGVFANGTQVQVMGFTMTHYQVIVDGRRGFVPRDALTAAGDDQARIKAAEPQYYDSLIPGMEAAYERINTRLETLTNQYGDINEWPIPLRAQWSQEQIEAGTLDQNPDIWVHLMPGQGDLTEETARGRADAELIAKGLDPKAYLQVFSYYFVRNGERDKRLWQFTYRGGPDNTDWVVQLNQQGEVVEFRSIENAGSPFPYGLDGLMEGAVVKPLPDEITNQQAADIAWDLFTRAYPEHQARETYDMRAALRASNNMRAWVITIALRSGDGMNNFMELVFHAALRASTGAVVYSSDAEMYAESVGDFQRFTKQMDMEKTRGPLMTWSLEDKALLYPEIYLVPGEGQMTQEEAWAIAEEALKEQKGWTDEHTKTYTPYFFFCKPTDDLPLRWDIQVLTEGIAEGNMDGFYVCVDATNGDILWVYGPGDTNG